MKDAKDVKKEVLKKIIEQMMAKGGEGLQKVTVMAKDKEGLKKGLEKAEEVVGDESEVDESCPACDDVECEGCEEENADDSKADLKAALFKKLMDK